MIWEGLEEELIVNGIEAKDSTEVLKVMGEMVIKAGYAKESYVDALIKRESEFPTGLDIGGFGIAIPHTDVSHVNKAATAVGVLKEPVDFIQMGTDDELVKVNIVFMLAVDDPKAHISTLQRLIEILQDKNTLEKLKAAKESADIIAVIRQKELELEKAS